MKAIKYSRFMGLVVFLGAVFTHAITKAQSKTSDFGGTWILNVDKCDFGMAKVPNKNSMILNITQLNNTIRYKVGDSSEHTEYMINLDGAPSVQTMFRMINNIPNVMKRPLNVQLINKLAFVAAMSDSTALMLPSSRTFSLSPNMQVLTVNYKVKYSNAEIIGKLVYDKKKPN